MSCPSKECHTNVQDMRITVKELVICMGKKISTNLAIAFLAFALTFSGGFILYGLAAEKEQNRTIGKNKEDISVIKTDLKHIAKNQEEMKDSIKRIEEKQISKAELVEAIKKAMEK